MKTETLRIRICPKCGAGYTRTPALSREDNQTLICPDCGTREALASTGQTDSGYVKRLLRESFFVAIFTGR